MSTLSPFRPACCFPFSPSDLKLIPYLTPQRRARLELFRPTVRYLSGTEVHVYALAISASVLLSFFPFRSKVDPLSHSPTPRPPGTLPAHRPLPQWHRGACLRSRHFGQRAAFLFPLPI